MLLICCSSSSSASDHSLGVGFLWLYVDIYSWSRAKWSSQLSGSDTDLILREASAVGQVIYSTEVATHSINSGGRWMWLSRCRYQHCWELGEKKTSFAARQVVTRLAPGEKQQVNKWRVIQGNLLEALLTYLQPSPVSNRIVHLENWSWNTELSFTSCQTSARCDIVSRLCLETVVLEKAKTASWHCWKWSALDNLQKILFTDPCQTPSLQYSQI